MPPMLAILRDGRAVVRTLSLHSAATVESRSSPAPVCVRAGNSMNGERDRYGRCSSCGLGRDDTDHIPTCRYRREWRPLLMDEYPPPGRTRLGRRVEKDGQAARVIEVYAVVSRRGTA